MPMIIPAAAQQFSFGMGLASNVGGGLTGAFSPIVVPLQDMATTIVRYDVNANWPFIIPSPDQLIGLYHAGLIDREQLRFWLKKHGVAIDWNVGADVQSRRWWQVVTQSEPTPPVATIVNKRLRGRLDDTTARHYLKIQGLATIDKQNLVLFQDQPLEVGLLLSAANRGDMPLDEVRTQLLATGYTFPGDAETVLKQRFQLPGPSDLIHFMVRDVWQAPIVERFGYDTEYPPAFGAWMAKQGLDWKPSDLAYPVGPGEDITWSRAYWRAHWQVLSPGQAGDALNRLRPRAPGNPQSRIDGVPSFTPADYDLIMRTQDYPPIVRQWLLGLSYQPLPVRRLQAMYEQGVINVGELFESFRDWSYTPVNAQRMVDLVLAASYQKLTAKARMQLANAARKGYLDGWLSDEQTAAVLYRASATSFQSQSNIDAMPAADLVTTAMARPEIQLELNALQLQRNQTKADAVIQAVKRSALRREITSDRARQLLAGAGVQQYAIDEYITLWELELIARGKNASAAQVVTWLKRGSITESEAVLRLQAFGYNSRDSALIVATARQDMAIVQQRTLEKQARTQQQIQRAQMAQLKAADANRRRIIADLSKSASRAGILAFLKDGYISTAEAKTALMNRGILSRDADLWIADALKGNTSAKKAKSQAVPASQAAGTTGSGSTGGSGG